VDRGDFVERHAIDEIGDVASVFGLGVAAQRNAVADRALPVIADIESRQGAENIAVAPDRHALDRRPAHGRSRGGLG
jgi:hypothetical protein